MNSVADCKLQISLSSSDFASLADASLRAWFAQRPELIELLQPPRAPVLFLWHKDMLDDGLHPHHNVGRWYFLQLKEWKPPPPEGTDKDCGTLGKHVFMHTIHAASMYTLAASLVHGLLPGPRPGKGTGRAFMRS